MSRATWIIEAATKETVIAFPSHPDTERHIVTGVPAKHVARMIADKTGQEAIWTGKVMGEWHIRHKQTRKISAIVYEK